MEEIKTCPFCGGRGLAVFYSGNGYFMECACCRARGPFSTVAGAGSGIPDDYYTTSEEIAVAAWNRRVVRPVMCESCKHKVNECDAEYKIVCASYEEN